MLDTEAALDDVAQTQPMMPPEMGSVSKGLLNILKTSTFSSLKDILGSIVIETKAASNGIMIDDDDQKIPGLLFAATRTQDTLKRKKRYDCCYHIQNENIQ